MAGGSQSVDTRWGKKLIRQLHGKIVNGVLTTEPIPDLVIPWITWRSRRCNHPGHAFAVEAHAHER